MHLLHHARSFATSLPLLPLLAAAASAQQVVYVDAAATGAGDGTSWADAFVDLQDALALAPDQVWVADGTYTPAGPNGPQSASFALASGTALYGGFAGGETSLEQRDPTLNVALLSGDLNGDDVPLFQSGYGDNADHVVSAIGVDGSALLDGFVIRGGHGGGTSGAGVFVQNASPTVRACRIEGNLAGLGGGMLVLGGSPVVEACEFQQNWTWLGRGGALYVAAGSAPRVLDCAFRWNRAFGASSPGDGGAIFVELSGGGSIERCLFERNVSEAYQPNYANGGAIANLGDALRIVDCVFDRNTAAVGGAIWNGRSIEMANLRFTGNSALVAGGLLNFFCDQTLVNCVFHANSAGEGGGITNGTGARVLLYNCILWANQSPGQPTYKAQIHDMGLGVTIDHSCVQALLTPVPGEDPPNPNDFPGSIEDDPLFADADGADGVLGTGDDDLHLAAGSPCIDAGNDGAVPAWLVFDLDGSPRVQNGAVDMGAYEFPGAACTAEPYCSAAPNSAGPGAHMSWSGSLSIAANDFTVRVDGAIQGQHGLFYYGPNAAQIPFGNGLRCVSGATFRLNPPVLVGPGGSAARQVDFTQPPAGSGPGTIGGGSIWRFQFWYRDPAGGGAGFNLSDGLRASFCP